jgi:hypothetical protein
VQKIGISAKTWELLRRSAEPYVDKTPDETLRRVLQSYLAVKEEKTMEHTVSTKEPHTDATKQPNTPNDAGKRAPRERGARVMLDGEVIVAGTVPDLFEQALKILVKKHRAKLEKLVPIKTSSARFLLAKAPKHPSGRSFVVPVEYDGFFMESHKSYEGAVASLQKLANQIGIPFKYLGLR